MGWPRRKDDSKISLAGETGSTTVSPGTSVADSGTHSTRTSTATQGTAGFTQPPLPDSERFYTTLGPQEIRLLRIEPANHGSPISCSLERHLLSEAPQYVAISYCWGPQEPSKTINLCGAHDFKVSTHLYHGLCRFRSAEEVKFIWVDALCINQSDPGERSHQVGQMRSIYGQAWHVLIWLGELDPRKTTCPCHIPDGVDGDTQAVCAEKGLSAFEHSNVGKVIREKLHADERRSREQEDLGQVWWKRLWCVQEFAVARHLPTVQIGPHTISWEFFAERLWAGDENHAFKRLRTSQPQTLRGLLLSTANDFYCSEPRDWIYGLIGLVDDDRKPAPNYSKTVSEVYEEALLYMMIHEQTVDVLVDDRTERIWTYPSWIPRFSLLRAPVLVRTVDKFHAGYGTPKIDLVEHRAGKVLCPCPSDQALRMRGMPFDRVHRKADMWKLARATSVPKELLKQFDIDFKKPLRHGIDLAPHIGYLMLEFMFAGNLSVLATFEKAHDELLAVHGIQYVPRVYYGEQLAKEYGFPYNKDTRLDLSIAQTFEKEFQRILKLSDHEKGARTFKNKFGNYTVPVGKQGRAFFSTETGYIGLGPASLQPGDSIIVPFGSSRPLIIRGHGDHYALVGDAVIHGIMSGQLVDRYRANTSRDDVFLLK
jgi:hypothetical protein